jgi:hypothetical protein
MRLVQSPTVEAVRFEHRLTEEVDKVSHEITKFKADLIRWMFIFWVGQIGVITGILFAFFKR